MGYLNNEEKTKESLDEEGWLHTGDIARIDKVGLFLKKGVLPEHISNYCFITVGMRKIITLNIQRVP